MTPECKKLVEKNLKLVGYCLNKLNVNKRYYEDVRSVGYLYLCLAAKKYKSGTYTFATFACSYIYGGMKTYIRKYEQNIIRLKDNKYQKFQIDNIDDYFNLSNDEEINVNDFDLDKFLSKIPSKYHSLVKGIYDGKKQKIIAKENNIIQSTISRKIYSLRKYIQKNNLTNELKDMLLNE